MTCVSREQCEFVNMLGACCGSSDAATVDGIVSKQN